MKTCLLLKFKFPDGKVKTVIRTAPMEESAPEIGYRKSKWQAVFGAKAIIESEPVA